LARHAIEQAMRVRETLRRLGYRMLLDSPTNQQFVIVTHAQYEALSEKFLVSLWQPVDDNHVAIRICTSWATLPENIDKLLRKLSTT
ncbi:MAG: low specificity L-threonine aldolase, partial [Bacteroidaceae bacterium]|nr:low specificity L-threonine aldolase [Bacteroidaceae bacterium]